MPRITKSQKLGKTRSGKTVTAVNQPRPRTHAFTGCGNCRDRHVKCGLETPACNNCARLKLNCEGYVRKYSWIPAKFGRSCNLKDAEDVDEAQSSRRVLFSDEERAAMSAQMTEECCIDRTYFDLDRVLRDLQDRISEVDEFSRIGPFGILSIGKDLLPGEIIPETLLPTEQEVGQHVEEVLRIETPQVTVPMSPINWESLDTFQGWECFATDGADVVMYPEDMTRALVSTENPLNQDLGIISDTQPSSRQNVESSGLELSPHVENSGNSDIDEIENFIATMTSEEIFIRTPNFACEPWTAPILTMSNDANLCKLPAEARQLLDHYSSKIIDAMSMAPGQKAPWRTIHLPCAKEAFAEIIVHGEAKSLAKLALFYALLSISSYHIGLSIDACDDRATYWRERGAEHKKKSEYYLRSVLRNDMPKAARGKYKEVLMSVLSMVTIGVFSGNMQDAHTYLAESETLIRVQGLPKRIKSQKISKLHHIFSFLRIIHESTSLRAKSHSQRDDQAVYSIEQDALRLSGDSSNSRLAWADDEEPEDIEEDSLFVSIYQMPTTLLSLLSQTSSLCKQLSSLKMPTPSFDRRCKIIEDRIFKWKAPESLRLPDNGPQSPHSSGTGQEVAAHLVQATYHALIVHFQRQIRNTNPRILQHYVTMAADHLLIHEQLKQGQQLSTAPFPWPGFIVGCEAYDSAARQKMDMYFKMTRHYNVGNLIKAEKVVYEVWRRHDEGRIDCHWQDVLQDWDMQIVLT